MSRPAKNVSLKVLAMTYFWELAASYFSGTRKALKPTICQSLRAINMWFCHPRSFSLAFAFAILGLGVFFFLFFFLKSLWERVNLIQPMVPCAAWACSYTTFGPRTMQELGGFAMKPQAWDTGHLGSSPPHRWPTSAHNSSLFEPLGEKVRVFQVDIVYTPKFIPAGHSEPILCGACCTPPSAIEIGAFSRGVQLKVMVMPYFF